MQTNKRLWFMWVVATSIGSLVAYFIGAMTLGFFVFPDIPPIIGWPILELIVGSVAGATLGALQWLILRPHVRQGQRWILVTALGTAVALSASVPLNVSSTPVFYGVLLGISLGIFQGLVVSHQRLLVITWILVSTIAWTIGMSVYCSCGLARFVLEQTIPYEVLILAPGVIAGSITGCVIVWLFHHSRKAALSNKEQTI
jgi:hypothetical protein